MKKASVNYWVDLATGVAFLLCAVTGIVFLFPSAVHTAAGAAPTILFTPALWWHKVHDWSGVVMVAGTALHLALHAKWIVTMTRRTFGAKAGAAASRTAPAGAGRPSPATRPSDRRHDGGRRGRSGRCGRRAADRDLCHTAGRRGRCGGFAAAARGSARRAAARA